MDRGGAEVSCFVFSRKGRPDPLAALFVGGFVREASDCVVRQELRQAKAQKQVWLQEQRYPVESLRVAENNQDATGLTKTEARLPAEVDTTAG